MICLQRLGLRGVAIVSASAGCGMAFTTADTMSGMSAAVRGRVFNLFSHEAPGLSGFPLFFPAVAGVLVAGDLVCAGGLLSGDFFRCAVVSVDFFADDCDFFPLGFGGILITLLPVV